MTEWDDDRADILGRKIDANIPPAISKQARLPWWLCLFIIAPVIIIRLIAWLR